MMESLMSIRIALYAVTAFILYAIGFKVFFSVKGMKKCEFKTALIMVGVSMVFFGCQLMGWVFGDSIKDVLDINPLPINIATSISAVFVLVAMLYAVLKIQKYLGDEK